MGLKRTSTVVRRVVASEPTRASFRPLQSQVWWLDFDPTVGTEIRKKRPALIVSPDDLNHNMPRLIVAPLTTAGRPLGCRPELRFKGRKARILLDQIRSVDKSRLLAPMGRIDQAIWKPVLLEMFS